MNAVRDCKAYMHRDGIVKISDAMKVPILNEFIESYDSGFIIESATGEIWTIHTGDDWFNPQFILKVNGVWSIPIINKERTHLKVVPLVIFNNPDVHVAIQYLDAGVYIHENNEYEAKVNRDISPEIQDEPFIQTFTHNGVTVRMFIPLDDIQFAPSNDEHLDSQNNPE